MDTAGVEPRHWRAIHLEDRAEPFRYSPDALSRLDRDQVQRLRTANERASYEDRRATTHPMELIFFGDELL